jgi:hypothetical protein
MGEVLWEIMCQGGTSLALGQYFDHSAVPLDAQLITRKQPRVVGSRAFAQKTVPGAQRGIAGLCVRLQLPRLICRCGLEDAKKALADMACGHLVTPVLDIRGRCRVELPDRVVHLP